MNKIGKPGFWKNLLSCTLLLTGYHFIGGFNCQSQDDIGLVILKPAGGEELVLGSDYLICWQSKVKTGKLTLELWKDGYRLGDIAENVALEKREFLWKVGTFGGRVVKPGEKYAIQFRTPPGPYQASAVAGFSIVPKPPVMSGDQRLAAHVAISPYNTKTRNEKMAEGQQPWAVLEVKIQTGNMTVAVSKMGNRYCLDGKRVRQLLEDAGLNSGITLFLETGSRLLKLADFDPVKAEDSATKPAVRFSTINDCIPLKRRFYKRILRSNEAFLQIQDREANRSVRIPIRINK